MTSTPSNPYGSRAEACQPLRAFSAARQSAGMTPLRERRPVNQGLIVDRFPDSPMSHRSGYGNRLVTLPGCKAVRSYYPRNARRRPSVPLIRLMAINLVPGTSRPHVQGVYGATRGVVGIKGHGYSLIDPERPLPTSRRPVVTTLPCSKKHPEGLTRLSPTASRREGGGCQSCQPDFCDFSYPSLFIGKSG